VRFTRSVFSAGAGQQPLRLPRAAAHGLNRFRQRARVLFYLRMDGGARGLLPKSRQRPLRSRHDTYESRCKSGCTRRREFSAIGRCLAQHGLQRVRLLTNNPEKAAGLRNAGLEVVTERLIVEPRSERATTLSDKAEPISPRHSVGWSVRLRVNLTDSYHEWLVTPDGELTAERFAGLAVCAFPRSDPICTPQPTVAHIRSGSNTSNPLRLFEPVSIVVCSTLRQPAVEHPHARCSPPP